LRVDATRPANVVYEEIAKALAERFPETLGTT
jgi:hypothetical protein